MLVSLALALPFAGMLLDGTQQGQKMTHTDALQSEAAIEQIAAEVVSAFASRSQITPTDHDFAARRASRFTVKLKPNCTVSVRAT